MQNFNDYLSNAWRSHGDQPEGVAQSLPEGLRLVENESQLAQLCQLQLHIFTDHIPRYSEGQRSISSLKNSTFFSSEGESGSAVRRGLKILEICESKNFDIEGFSTSDQVRILAAVAGGLGASDLDLSFSCLERAKILSQQLTSPSDAAYRALAVCANNLACTLEEQSHLNEQQLAQLVTAAEWARTYWEKIGTWKEVMWAEYRLTKSCLKVKNAKRAVNHSEMCLNFAKLNQAPPSDLFYAYEAAALAQKAFGNHNNFVTLRDEALSILNHLPEDQQIQYKSAAETLR